MFHPTSSLFVPTSYRVLFIVGGASLNRKMNTGNEDLAWALAEAGVDVHIIAGGMRPEEHSYNLPPRVFYYFTEKSSGIAEPGEHMELYKTLTQRLDFDFVIGWLLFLEPILRARSDRGTGPIFIANEGQISRDRRGNLRRLWHAVATIVGHSVPRARAEYENHRARGRGPISAWRGLSSAGAYVDFAVPISGAVMKNCQDFYRIPAEKCRVIYGGIDHSTFAPDPRIDRRRLGNPPRLIFSGDVKVSKGVMDVVDALYLIETPVELVLCGNDPEMLVPELTAKLDAGGHGHRLVYKGALGHDALSKELKEADIFVFCSWTEGLGKSLLEAMACGLPVVVSDIDVFKEFVVDGQNGLIARLQAPNSIALAIDRFLHDPDLRDRCGREANKSMEKFNIRNEAGAWIDLFGESKITAKDRGSSWRDLMGWGRRIRVRAHAQAASISRSAHRGEGEGDAALTGR